MEEIFRVADLALGQRSVGNELLTPVREFFNPSRALLELLAAVAQPPLEAVDFALFFEETQVQLLQAKQRLEFSSQSRFLPLAAWRTWWAHQDSNLGPEDYESPALTN